MCNVYEVTYANDRRTHRHRCQRCWKIVRVGDQALMYRVSNTQTRVLHVECADRLTFDGITHRQLAQLHSDAYRARHRQNRP